MKKNLFKFTIIISTFALSACSSFTSNQEIHDRKIAAYAPLRIVWDQQMLKIPSKYGANSGFSPAYWMVFDCEWYSDGRTNELDTLYNKGKVTMATLKMFSKDYYFAVDHSKIESDERTHDQYISKSDYKACLQFKNLYDGFISGLYKNIAFTLDLKNRVITDFDVDVDEKSTP